METKSLQTSFESLKRDVKRTVRAATMTSQHPVGLSGTEKASDAQPMPPERKPRIMDPIDLDYLKDDVIESLRLEVRQVAREAVQRQSSVVVPSDPLPLSGDLYQTHLYTQL